MALDNYGWFVVVVVAIVLSITIMGRIYLYKKHRRQAQLAASRGLPFPVMTNTLSNSWRPSSADRPPGGERLTRGQNDVVRVASRTDGDLPSYHDPGIKIPEAMYNPNTSPVVPSLSNLNSSSQPPLAAPLGAPPGYHEPSSNGR